MITFYGSSQVIHLKSPQTYPEKTVVVIGNFDGVHLGHQALIQEGFKLAQTLNVALCVYTFNPHPTLELRPQAHLKLLMTYEEKLTQLDALSVPFCVEEKFNTEFASTSAHDFFYDILLKRLKVCGIVVGTDFTFGSKRQGNIELLEQYCKESSVILKVVSPFLVEGSPVSSSRIRDTLQAGDLIQAQKLLGRPFFYRGEVIHGEKRGRMIGFPTANMRCGEKFPIPPGVYVTSVVFQGKVYPSVTNIGKRPTFQSESELPTIPLRIETHILGQTFDLYGQMLEVQFLKRLREERKFLSVDELKHQIQTDILLAREFIES